MNLLQSVLDALVDDSESMVQIRNYLKYYKVSYADDSLKEIILRLLDESKIVIVYPPDSNIADFINAGTYEIYGILV